MPDSPRIAIVEGLQLAEAAAPPFTARVELELRSDGVYYTWRAESESGAFLASSGQSVSLRIIPTGEDPFEHALAHAAEDLNRYRSGRAHLFQVTAVRWV